MGIDVAERIGSQPEQSGSIQPAVGGKTGTDRITPFRVIRDPDHKENWHNSFYKKLKAVSSITSSLPDFRECRYRFGSFDCSQDFHGERRAQPLRILESSYGPP